VHPGALATGPYIKKEGEKEELYETSWNHNILFTATK
jgi:hypothetical protein